MACMRFMRVRFPLFYMDRVPTEQNQSIKLITTMPDENPWTIMPSTRPPNMVPGNDGNVAECQQVLSTAKVLSQITSLYT